VGVHLNRGAEGLFADVAGVLQEALVAALEPEDELGEGGVWDEVEGVADSSADFVDSAC
jgi:hypothetical protein